MNIVSRDDAKKQGLTHYFTGKPCKYGHYATRSIKGRKCLECDRINKKRIRLANPEKVREQKRIAYYKHIEKSLARRKRYIENNRGAVNALNAARKRRIRQAVPIWVDKEHKKRIKEIYELADIRTRLFGYSWHVDHIIPIQGKNVCGLHVAENLRVIIGTENISKKNKYEIDNVD